MSNIQISVMYTIFILITVTVASSNLELFIDEIELGMVI